MRTYLGGFVKLLRWNHQYSRGFSVYVWKLKFAFVDEKRPYPLF